jgi:hypothetical protein
MVLCCTYTVTILALFFFLSKSATASCLFVVFACYVILSVRELWTLDCGDIYIHTHTHTHTHTHFSNCHYELPLWWVIVNFKCSKKSGVWVAMMHITPPDLRAVIVSAVQEAPSLDAAASKRSGLVGQLLQRRTSATTNRGSRIAVGAATTAA